MATACNLTPSQTFPNQFREKFHNCLLVYLQVIVYILKIIIFSLVHSCSDFHKDLQQYYPFVLQSSLLFSDAFREGQKGTKRSSWVQNIFTRLCNTSKSILKINWKPSQNFLKHYEV